MIDISDGLASEILHICEINNLGCRIFEDKIPIDHQKFNTSIAGLSGGEDYELLFTIAL